MFLPSLFTSYALLYRFLSISLLKMSLCSNLGDSYFSWSGDRFPPPSEISRECFADYFVFGSWANCLREFFSWYFRFFSVSYLSESYCRYEITLTEQNSGLAKSLKLSIILSNDCSIKKQISSRLLLKLSFVSSLSSNERIGSIWSWRSKNRSPGTFSTGGRSKGEIVKGCA